MPHFTDDALEIIEHAKKLATLTKSNTLTIEHVLQSLIGLDEHRLKISQEYPKVFEGFLTNFPPLKDRKRYAGSLPASDSLKQLILSAQERAGKVRNGAAIDAEDLQWAVCQSPHVKEVLEQCVRGIANTSDLQTNGDTGPKAIQSLTCKLQTMREDLLKQILGQDHAVHAFVDGLFNAEVVADIDDQRHGPRAIFVFAGPPGVGKTYLATLGAEAIDRPFKRLDMSGYSGSEQHLGLVGMPKMYRGARAGDLTGFVADNPNAVLLFDEIEKASLDTIHLFLQLLDTGRLDDKFTKTEVNFRDCIVIFTTNAGRALYEDPNQTGVQACNANVHRQTLLDALANETSPKTGQPVFPQAICSRLATGWPILFNRLGIAELQAVSQMELDHVGALLSKRLDLDVTFDRNVATCLLLREGLTCDARILRAQSESFAKGEIFKLSRLWESTTLAEKLDQARELRFLVEGDDAHDILGKSPTRNAQILLVADADLCQLYQKSFGDQTGVDWLFASQADEATSLLAEKSVDCVLMDIFIGSPHAAVNTLQFFDHLVPAARDLRTGQELLRRIRHRAPDAPVYLLDIGSSNDASFGSSASKHLDELITASIASGGARGAIVTQYEDIADPKPWRDDLAEKILAVGRQSVMEAEAAILGQQHQVLRFETAPHVIDHGERIEIRLRNFEFVRALTSGDTGSVLDDVQRPDVTFDDVIGADGAKQELAFFRDYLQDPRRFAANGLRSPKGVLLYGPPGTGKTLLARALAGESDVAFIPTNASNFMTMWQGSGPQSIRDLFARARRYAPAIIFIDEIDAIGGSRTGGPASRSEENTLNALLTELDGFTSPSATRPVFVLAATNARINADDVVGEGRTGKMLDSALTRRFDRKILVDLPDHAARLKYLQAKVANTIAAKQLKAVADRAYGMSLADLEAVVEMARRLAMREQTSLAFDHLDRGLDEVQYGETRPRSDEEKRRTAYHEAGHALMYHHSGHLPVYVTIVSRGSHGGYMAPDPEEAMRGCLSIDNLTAKIRVLLGGRAAEIVQFGPRAGLTTGASSDLARATRLARDMACRFGMDEEIGPVVLSELTNGLGLNDETLARQVTQAAHRIATEQLAQTIAQLTQNKDQLDRLAEAMICDERLTGDQMKDLLGTPP